MSDCSTPGGCGPSTTVCGTGGWNGPKPGDPDNNSILRAEPGYGGIQLYWTMPNINDHAVAHTRVFRNITDQFATAIPLVVIAGNNYFDTGAGDPIRQYFYWIQHVSINGTVLDPIGPAWATARPYLEQILQDLAEQIEDGMLARSLRSRIDKIADLEAGLTILNNLVITENEVVSQELVGLRNDVTNAMVYIDQQNTLRITEQAALVSSVNTLVAQMSDNLSAAIQQEMLVIAEDIGDLQGQYTLKIDLGGYVSGFGLSSRVDPTGAQTSEFGVLASSFFIGPPSVVSPTAPSNPFHGKVWVDTSGGGSVTKWYNRFSLQWQTTPVKGAVPFIVKTSPEVMPDGYTIEPGVYMDSAFIGRLTANQIDTRGLTIRDTAGNLILGAGTGLDWSLVQGVNKPQDRATVGANESNLNVGLGINLLPNSDLLLNDSGWSIGWNQSGVNDITLGRNLAGDSWRPFNTNTYGISRSGTPTGVWDFRNTNEIPVVPGTRYEGSAYIACHRCSATVALLFYDAAGNQLQETHSTSTTASGGQNLSNWAKLVVFATAPVNSAYVRFFVRSTANGGTNPFTWAAQSFVGVAGAAQTVASNWSPANFAERITSANASTYIANAAIGAAQIGSLALTGTNNFSVKTAITGARMEMDSRSIKVFDANGVKRVQIGDLTA